MFASRSLSGTSIKLPGNAQERVSKILFVLVKKIQFEYIFLLTEIILDIREIRLN